MPEIHEHHTYRIINVKSGTALDLSGTDGHTISGWEAHDGDNQKWHAERINNQWAFRNRFNERYLGLSNSYEFHQGNRLQGVEEPFGWNIFPDREYGDGYRIFVPEHNANVDLDLGHEANGTKVHLWGQWNAPQQIWRFEEA